jgi:dCMP deaminase
MNWDTYFIEIADSVSKKSHCLSHKFGAIAVRDDKFIVATGFNGPPAGYTHCKGEVCPRHRAGFASGQGLEVCPAAHAELNVLIEAARIGVSLNNCKLYITSPLPCRECAKAIVNAGIQTVICSNFTPYPDIGLSGTRILEECGVKIRGIVKE